MLFRVTETDADDFAAKAVVDFLRAAVEYDARPTASLSGNLDFLPIEPTPSGAECLHRGHLGGEARGVALVGSGARATVRAFGFGENAALESLSPTREGGLDARDFDEINADTDVSERLYTRLR